MTAPAAGAETPYWRLSFFYLFYFGALGAVVPWWAVHLEGRGYGVVEIGTLMSIFMATKIVAPYIWGWLGDHTGKRLLIVRVAALISALAFLGVFVEAGFWWMAFVMALFSFFWNASLPQMEATTLQHLGSRSHRYARIRLWGSVGFVVASVGLGYLLDIFGTHSLPAFAFFLYVGIWLTSLLVPDAGRATCQEHGGSILHVVRRGPVLAFLLGVFLMQLSHGPYYTFFSVYLEDFGFNRTTIGLVWAWGVVAEVLVFIVMHRLLVHYGAKTLLVAAMALTALRWMLTAWFGADLAIMILVQTIHAASYGVAHAASIHFIHRYFKGRHQVRGQALYSSLSFGAGGALGNLSSGYLWEGLGPELTYMIAGAIAALAAVVILLGVSGEESRVSEGAH